MTRVWNRPDTNTGPTADLSALFERDDLWDRLSRRIRHWQAPPSWSPRDWAEELRAQAAAATCQALHDFDPGRGVPLDAFLWRRVLAGVYQLHREEWRQARRRESVAQSPRADHRADPFDESLRDTVTHLVASLDESDRRLVEALFWEGATERELASAHGLSQQAISKRKARLITLLREALRGHESR